MLEKKHFDDIITAILIVGLFILAILIIRPVLISIFFGVLFAYVFYPIYNWVLKKVKNPNFSAFIVCLGLLIIIFIILGIVIGSLFSQVVNFYVTLQEINLTESIGNLIPAFSSSDLSLSIANSLSRFVSRSLAGTMEGLGDFALNLPANLLQLFVVIFIFFFSLRDGKEAMKYVASLSPLKKETHEKFSKQFRDITYSVLVGQIIVGILQGVISGIGYFIFGVPNALVLTLLTMFVGIIPLIGPWLVWVPVDVYLFSIGRSGAGLGLLIYGLIIISWLDTFIRPLIVSRKTQINSAIVIIGMIGGLFVFGILGLIIGPLVLAYVLLAVELYRKKTLTESIIFKEME